MLLRTKEEIQDWLSQYKINNYELIKDEEYGYVVNINDNVDLHCCELKNIEIKFNEING